MGGWDGVVEGPLGSASGAPISQALPYQVSSVQRVGGVAWRHHRHTTVPLHPNEVKVLLVLEYIALGSARSVEILTISVFELTFG